MLSSRIGRHAVRQFNPSASALLHRMQPNSYVPTDNQTSSTIDLAIRTRPISTSQILHFRGFATAAVASKPKAHTGRKKAGKVKAKAKPASVAGTKKTVRKTPAKKGPAKKPKVKAKKAVKKSAKKPAKKAVTKPKAKPKKAITPEEKEKILRRELRAKALTSPHGLPSTAWTVLMAEVSKDTRNLGNSAKEAAVKYKSLLPEERERYNHIAHENKNKNNVAYEAWIQTHTPYEIRLANNARVHLRRLGTKPGRWSTLKDQRQLKRPALPRLLFAADRWASGDLQGLKVTEASRLLSREWEALPAAEKKKYADAYAEANAKYLTDRVKVYGEPAVSKRKSPTAKDSAAASAQVQREANA